MGPPPLRSADRGATSVVGVLLLIAVAIIVGVVVTVVALGISEDLNDPQPELAVDASFDARGPLDPHWVFAITHISGENIEPGELTIRLVDEFGNEANRTYPGSFTAGQEIRVGLWGSPNRADINGVNCLTKPEDPPGATNDQLVGTNPPASEVDVVVVHEPTNSLMDRVVVNLGDYPNRYGTRLLDGSNPSFGCNDVRWRSGDVVPTD